MAAIINRTPTGRIISLHSELRYLKKRFGRDSFELKGLKYDSTEKYNPLMFFPLAETHSSIGLYDPYLDNPLSPAKFHLTQSIQYDTQKSKSASECLNALEALGWITREGNLSKLSDLGLNIADIPYESKDLFQLARDSVLGYGVFIGFLFKCFKNLDRQDIVNKGNVEIGYPDTHEVLEINGRNVPLSTGSQKDTIVRTRSTLFAWAITTGFALPYSHTTPGDKLTWHVDTLDEIKNKHWGWNKIKMYIPSNLFSSNPVVDRPLSYRWMTKSTKALRERGQESIRNASLNEEVKVKNRRFAIVYLLGMAAEKKQKLVYSKVVIELSKYAQYFVVNPNDFERVMKIELDIATISGIPFEESNGILTPLTELNMEKLKEGAPDDVVKAIREVFERCTVL